MEEKENLPASTESVLSLFEELGLKSVVLFKNAF